VLRGCGWTSSHVGMLIMLMIVNLRLTMLTQLRGLMPPESAWHVFQLLRSCWLLGTTRVADRMGLKAMTAMVSDHVTVAIACSTPARSTCRSDVL
jgi:hypothetical protein